MNFRRSKSDGDKPLHPQPPARDETAHADMEEQHEDMTQQHEDMTNMANKLDGEGGEGNEGGESKEDERERKRREDGEKLDARKRAGMPGDGTTPETPPPPERPEGMPAGSHVDKQGKPRRSPPAHVLPEHPATHHPAGAPGSPGTAVDPWAEESQTDNAERARAEEAIADAKTMTHAERGIDPDAEDPKPYDPSQRRPTTPKKARHLEFGTSGPQKGLVREYGGAWRKPVEGEEEDPHPPRTDRVENPEATGDALELIDEVLESTRYGGNIDRAAMIQLRNAVARL